MAFIVDSGFRVTSALPADLKYIWISTASLYPSTAIYPGGYISSSWRYVGMIVFCQDDTSEYKLLGGIGDNNWVKITNGNSYVSASYAPGSPSISASYADSSSVSLYSDFSGTASYALFAEFADTASLALYSDFAGTASYAITTSLCLSSSIAISSISSDFALLAGIAINATSASVATFANSASWAPGSGTSDSASWASSSISSSYTLTASYALNGGTSTGNTTQSLFSTQSLISISASWASSSISSSYAISSSVCLSASVAISSMTSDFALLAGNAINANTASYAATSSYLIGFNFDNTSSIISSPNTQTIITQISTGSYIAAFFDYAAVSESNIRAGIIFGSWVNGSINYTEVSNIDIGDTSPVTMSLGLQGATLQLSASANTIPWTIRAMARYL